jgi:hypothetical protein
MDVANASSWINPATRNPARSHSEVHHGSFKLGISGDPADPDHRKALPWQPSGHPGDAAAFRIRKPEQ